MIVPTEIKMESSVEKQIQRIKMHEQDNEIKLREKRECKSEQLLIYNTVK